MFSGLEGLHSAAQTCTATPSSEPLVFTFDIFAELVCTLPSPGLPHIPQRSVPATSGMKPYLAAYFPSHDLYIWGFIFNDNALMMSHLLTKPLTPEPL